MTHEEWIDYKERFYDALEAAVAKLNHRRGRKPQEYHEFVAVLSDADLRRKMQCTTFLELEQKVSFWQ